jgi:uncharacterized protein (DUF4415 family)
MHFSLRAKRLSGEWFDTSVEYAEEAIHKAAELVGLPMKPVAQDRVLPNRLTQDSVSAVNFVVAADLPIKRGPGRPPTGNAKKKVNIRIDQDIISALRRKENWQPYVNNLLRKHLTSTGEL